MDSRKNESVIAKEALDAGWNAVCLSSGNGHRAA
jgi:hypothetical protein